MELRYEPRALRALKRIGARDRATIVDTLEAFVAGRLLDAVLIVHIGDRKDVYRG